MNNLDDFTLTQIYLSRAKLRYGDDKPNVYEEDKSFIRRIYIKMLKGYHSTFVEFEDGLTMGYDRAYLK